MKSGIRIFKNEIADLAMALQKRNGSTFRILAFTDLHLDDYAECGYYTWKALKKTIQKEVPDLVLFLGDNITGGDNKNRLEEFCNGMDDLGVLWCPILGNHEGDNPLSVTRKQMVHRFAWSQNCLMEADEKYLSTGEKVDGEGNYVIHLLNEKEQIMSTLVFLDCGVCIDQEEKERLGLSLESTAYDYIKPSQIRWYQEILAKRDSKAPVIVLGHIPLVEYDEAYDNATEHDTSYEHGVTKERESKWLYGYRRERICSSGYNTGMFAAMRDSGVKNTYICGHDHINDFRVEYQGVQLMYNIMSGYSSYNVISKKNKITVGKTDKLLQGCSLYTIGENGYFDVEAINYEDRYPEMQEGVREVIRK